MAAKQTGARADDLGSAYSHPDGGRRGLNLNEMRALGMTRKGTVGKYCLLSATRKTLFLVTKIGRWGEVFHTKQFSISP
jgi:hypothetical protein